MRTAVQVRAGTLAVVLGLCTVLVSPRPDASHATPSADSIEQTGPQQVTLKAGTIRMSLDFTNGAKIASLKVGGVEKLAAAGSGSIVQLDADGSVLSSAFTDGPPRVHVSRKEVRADFTMSNERLAVDETWRFRLRGDAITQAVRRTYRWTTSAPANRSIRHSAQPQMVWSTDAWDYIRKPEDGGTIPVGGERLNAGKSVV